MKSLSSRLSSMWKVFASAPLAFLVVQLPETSVNWADSLIHKQLEAKPWLVVFLIPYFGIVNAISVGVTALMAEQASRGEKPSLTTALRQLHGRLWPTLGAALLSMTVISLGMAAYFVPGILFMAIYVFVPVVGVLEEPRRVFGILARASNLSLSRFKAILGLTAVFLAIALLLFLLEGEFGKFIEERRHWRGWIEVFSLTSLVFGVAVNLGIYEIYRWLQPAFANTASANEVVSVPTNN